MNKKYKAAIIIGTFSTAAAAWSAATAAVPVIGPLLADTTGLTLITIALAYSLSALYGKNLDTASLTAFAAVVLGAIAGNLALKAGASLIPIFGSYFNAATTATLHAAIGWGIYKIYEDGKDLKDISKTDFQKYMERSKTEAEASIRWYEEIYSKLSDEDKKTLKALQRKLKNKNLSMEERDNIDRQVEALFQ